MGFSHKRQFPDMPPLIEEVKAGEPIVFDEDEQHAIDRELKRHEKAFKGRIFPKDVADTIEDGLASEALMELAKSKLHSGDLKGAASTCIKSLGLFSKYEGGWLLLAEIFAEHGDIVRSRGFLDIAKKVHEKNKNIHEKSFEPVWKNNVQRVQDIIRSKQPK